MERKRRSPAISSLLPFALALPIAAAAGPPARTGPALLQWPPSVPLALISQADARRPVRSYSTHFPLAETLISEHGRWLNGKKDGLDWFDVEAKKGHAYGTESQGAYTDPTALLTGKWGPNQVVRATVFTRNQAEKYFQEVEIRLRSTLSPHQCTGYEVFWRCLKTPEAYVQIVRWNGKLGDWTSLQKQSGAKFGVKDGDLVQATISGNQIKGFLNGEEVISAVDNTFPAGSPGMGFNYGVEKTNADFGFTQYEVETDNG